MVSVHDYLVTHFPLYVTRAMIVIEHARVLILPTCSIVGIKRN